MGTTLTKLSPFKTNNDMNNNVGLTRMTECPSEVKTMTWKIRDLSTLMNLSNPTCKPEFTFTAGETIDMISTWAMVVSKKPLSQSGAITSIGFHFRLVQSEPDTTSVYAAFDVSIKDIFSRQSTPSDFKPRIKGLGFYGNFDTSALEKCMVDNVLTINIKFTLYGKWSLNSSEPICTSKAIKRKAQEDVSSGLSQLFESGQCSDFIIRVKIPDETEHEEFKVHKVILALRSTVFRAMFEAPMQEQLTGEMTITDSSPKCISILLKFVYTAILDEDWKTIPEEIVDAAEKYDFPLLKFYLNNKLHILCNNENAINFLRIAKLYNMATAVSNIETFIKSNAAEVLLFHGIN